MPRSRTGWAGLALAAIVSLALVFVAGIVLTPRLERAGLGAGAWLRFGYGRLCHQIPERSLQVEGLPLAVCARCTGLYLGGAMGLIGGGLLLVPRRRRPRPLWLALAAAPTVVDALVPWVGFAGLSNLPRLVVSIPAGVLAGLFLAVGVTQIFDSASSDAASGSYPSRAPCTLEDVDG